MCDRAHGARAVVRAIDFPQCNVLCTVCDVVHGHYSRTLFTATVKKKKKKTSGNWGVTYMIDNHKERRNFLHVTDIMYELELMTFVLKSFLKQFLLRPTLGVIIHKVYDYNYIRH